MNTRNHDRLNSRMLREWRSYNKVSRLTALAKRDKVADRDALADFYCKAEEVIDLSDYDANLLYAAYASAQIIPLEDDFFGDTECDYDLVGDEEFRIELDSFLQHSGPVIRDYTIPGDNLPNVERVELNYDGFIIETDTEYLRAKLWTL